MFKTIFISIFFVSSLLQAQVIDGFVRNIMNTIQEGMQLQKTSKRVLLGLEELLNRATALSVDSGSTLLFAVPDRGGMLLSEDAESVKTRAMKNQQRLTELRILEQTRTLSNKEWEERNRLEVQSYFWGDLPELETEGIAAEANSGQQIDAASIPGMVQAVAYHTRDPHGDPPIPVDILWPGDPIPEDVFSVNVTEVVETEGWKYRASKSRYLSLCLLGAHGKCTGSCPEKGWRSCNQIHLTPKATRALHEFYRINQVPMRESFARTVKANLPCQLRVELEKILKFDVIIKYCEFLNEAGVVFPTEGLLQYEKAYRAWIADPHTPNKFISQFELCASF